MKNKIGICIFGLVAVVLIAFILDYFDKRFLNNSSETEQNIPQSKVYETVKEVKQKDSTEEKSVYSIKVENEMLVVYKDDNKMFDTGIELSDLPTDFCEKINDGVGFENEQELYDFLESYSS